MSRCHTTTGGNEKVQRAGNQAQAMPALLMGSRGRSRDTQPKPCSRASGSLWLGGDTAAGPRRGLCLQNTSPDSHPHPSSTQGSFLTVQNPKLEKPGWGGGEAGIQPEAAACGEAAWRPLCPRVPAPAEAGGALARCPPPPRLPGSWSWRAPQTPRCR